MSPASEFFKLDPQTAGIVEDATLHLAFAAAATSVQVDVEHALEPLFLFMHGSSSRPVDDRDIGLTLVIERLLTFIQATARASDHPLADSLRRHTDITDLQAEHLIGEAERFLRLENRTNAIRRILTGEGLA